jgi:hypothetical protein
VVTLALFTSIYPITVPWKPVFASPDTAEDYVDIQSDVDSVADKGTHSNFENQKATDSTYDTLTEANTNTSKANESTNFVDGQSDVDSHADHGIHSSFPAMQAGPDSTFDILTEANTGGTSTTLTNSPSATTGTWTNPTYAYSDDSSYAYITSATPSASQIYSGYGFNIPSDATITQVRVRYDAWSIYSTITFVNVGAEATGTGAVTPALPASMVSGDICILVATTIAGGTVTITATGSITTWTALTGSPIDVTLGEKLYVWWGRWTSGTTGPTVTPGSDHIESGIGAWRNCISSGSPIDVSETGTETTSDTSFSFATTISTTVNGAMCLCICTTGQDSNTNGKFTTMTDSSLTSLAERIDYCTSSGGGGGFALDEGYKATAGAVGTWASTLSAASTKAYISFALKPDSAYEQIRVDVSWDGGTSWSSQQATGLSGTQTTYWYNVTSATSWTPDKLSDTNLRVRVDAYTVDVAGQVNLDWIPVEATYTPANYELDLEFQWTTADFDETNEYLCIYTGTVDAEALKVDVWTGSWTNIISSLSASQWNNVSIGSYLTSETITFRFLGGTETSDTSQNTWQIDCAIIHVWSTGVNYELELEEQFTDCDYTRTFEELCIYMGAMNGETLSVQWWNSTSNSWLTIIASLSSNQWNNVSVVDYLTSATFTILFVDGTKTNDLSQGTWQKDACLLHTWTLGYNLNLRVMDLDLTDHIQGAYVYKDSDIKTSDADGWANWTEVSGTVQIKVQYFGFWVNETSLTISSDTTMSLQCKLYDVIVNVRENIRNAKLSNVNVTVYNSTNYKIKSGISDNNGQVSLLNLPNNTLTFTCYAKSDYSLVIKNVARNITQDEQIETIICDENYVGTTSNYSILVWVGGIMIPLEGSFVTKRLKRKMYKKRKKPK